MCLGNAPGSISNAHDFVKVVSGGLKITRKFDISSIGGNFDLAIRREFSNEQLQFQTRLRVAFFQNSVSFCNAQSTKYR